MPDVWGVVGCVPSDGESFGALLRPTNLLAESALGGAESVFSECLPWSTLCALEPGEGAEIEGPPSLYWFEERQVAWVEANVATLRIVNTGGPAQHLFVEAFEGDRPTTVVSVQVAGQRGSRTFSGGELWTPIPAGLPVPPPSLELSNTEVSASCRQWQPRLIELRVTIGATTDRLCIRTFSPEMRRAQEPPYDLQNAEGDAFTVSLD